MPVLRSLCAYVCARRNRWTFAYTGYEAGLLTYRYDANFVSGNRGIVISLFSFLIYGRIEDVAKRKEEKEERTRRRRRWRREEEE